MKEHRQKTKTLTQTTLTEFRVVTLVEEELAGNLLNDHIPGVARSRATHDGGEDGVGGIDVAVLVLCQLQEEKNKWVVHYRILVRRFIHTINNSSHSFTGY